MGLYCRTLLPQVLNVVLSLAVVCAEVCNNGRRCTAGQHCCASGCCFDNDEDYSIGYRMSIWNMWYFWFVVLFILMSCFGGCGYYKQRQRILRNQQSMGPSFLSVLQVTSRHRPGNTRIVTLETTGYTPPAEYNFAHSMDTAVNLAPPPYSEVVGNPDQFPVSNKNRVPDNQPYGSSSGSQSYVDAGAMNSAAQMPQPPPYSEVANQSSADNSSANQNTDGAFSTNQAFQHQH